MDATILGMVAQPAEKTDSFFNKQITRSFGAARPNEVGLDLISVDVQRGRDHGLPGIGIPNLKNTVKTYTLRIPTETVLIL